MSGAPRRYAVCQLGGRMHYAVARGLHDAGALERFFTDLYFRERWAAVLTRVPRALMPRPLGRLVSRGSPLPDRMVSAFPLFGLSYFLRMAWSRNLDGVFLWAGRTFGSRVAAAGFGGANAVYTFNTAALEILTAAKQQRLFTVVEQTIVPRAVEQELMAAEHRRFPEWEAPAHAGMAAATASREAAEWALADLIVCGSRFVLDGIRRLGGPVDRCVVVPYGVNLPPTPPRSERNPGRLRVLLVGHVSLRKGAPHVKAIAEQLGGDAEFRWVGPVLLADAGLRELSPLVSLIGAVPRADVADYYQWADVLLLPSVCEGSATVSYEALAAGLPVIATRSAGTPVRDGVDGVIVEAGDSDRMAASLQQLHRDRPRLAAMSRAAREGAAALTVAAYRDRLLPHLMGEAPRVRPGSGEPVSSGVNPWP